MRARSGGAPETAQNQLVEQVWALVVRPQVVGLLVLAAGLVLLATPWLRAPGEAEVSLGAILGGALSPRARDWWIGAVSAPDALSVSAGLLAAAAVLLGAMLWQRVDARRGAGDLGKIDATFHAESIPEDVLELAERPRTARWAWAGLAAMLVGLAILGGTWFGLQRDLAPAQATVARGQTLEHYTLEHEGAPLKVNLPRRVRLSELTTGDEPQAVLQIFRAGDNPAASPSITRTLPAGSGVSFDDVRLTFSGLASSNDAYRAVLTSSEPDTIPVSASIGDTFQFALGGPQYKVVNIQTNYLDIMGPAVEVEAPELGRFWVFQRHAQAGVPPNLGHPIRLERLESQVAAVMTVVPLHSFWPLSLGGTLLVLGFALFIAFPQRRVHVEGSEIRVASVNGAGMLTATLDAMLREGARAGEKASRAGLLLRGAMLAGWAGVVVTAVGIFAGQFTSLRALLLGAACAGLAALPAQIPAPRALRMVPGTVLVPLAVVVAAVGTQAEIAGGPNDLMLLLLAQWGLFVGALTLAFLAAIFGIGAGWRAPAEDRAADAPTPNVLRILARDVALRATILGWLSWVVTMLIHWRQFAAIGMYSPADWTFLATLLLMSSNLLLAGKGGRARFEPIFVLLLMMLGLGLAFGAPFGLLI